MSIIVDVNKCPQNHPCPSVRVCPVKALVQKGNDAPKIDFEKCINCNKCVNYCPMRAIKVVNDIEAIPSDLRYTEAR